MNLAKYIIIYSQMDGREGISYVGLSRILFALQYNFSRKYNYPLFFDSFYKNYYNIHSKKVYNKYGHYCATNIYMSCVEKLPYLKLCKEDINIINDIIEDGYDFSKTNSVAYKITNSEVWKQNENLSWREIRKRNIKEYEV